MRDKEISLVDIVVKILLGWRLILIWMLVGGILMGSLSYVRSYQTQKTQLQLLQVDEEHLRNRLTEAQLYNVYTVLEYESFYKQLESYFQESVKMHIDPFNVPRTELTFRVQAENLETTYQIEQIYEDVILAGLSKQLAEEEQEEISVAAMSELVELDSNVEDVAITSDANSFGLVAMTGERDSFSMIVYHVSEEQCLDLAERVAEYVQEQYSRLKKELGNHEIQLINQEFTFVVDRALLSMQRDIINDTIKYRNDSATLKEDFKEAEWQYYNYIKEYGEQADSMDSQMEEGAQTMGSESREPEEVMTIHPSMDLKWVLLGMILFALFYAFYVFVKCIFNDKIQASDDVTTIYGVNRLGLISSADKKKRIMAFVDNWIRGLFEKNKRRFSAEKSIELTATAVKIAARKAGLREVCCVGCNLQSDALAIADIISGILKSDNISMETVSDLLYDQEAMERVMSAKAVFLLEKAGETLYDEIDKELKFLQGQDISVFGIIVME